MNRTMITAFCGLLALLSAACSDGGSVGDGALQDPPELPAMPAFDTANTIRDVMNALVDVNADVLWEAVSYENSVENGEVIRQPETAEQWLELRHSAVAIMEGANALMIPGRHVAAPGSTTPYPDYEYTPEEVDQKLREDPVSWNGFAQGLFNAALMSRDAIEKRDVDALMQAGDVLDKACEACHSHYWYREEYPE